MRSDGRYDVIVLGLGAHGSATAYHTARRGARVLGLEAFGRGHANGSSHGKSRGIREAYGESPQYVPLVQRAYTLWRELEAEAGQHLLTITGGISAAPAIEADGENISRAAKRADPLFGANQRAAADQYGLTIEVLDADETYRRWPGLRLPDEYMTIYDPATGFLRPEQCVLAHLDLALQHGADLHHYEPARYWAADGDGVRVETDRGVYLADRLVVTAGPWAGQILADLGLPLTVTRQFNVYFAPTQPELYGPDVFPVYGFSGPEGMYYGVPLLPGDGFKIGRHDGGEPYLPDVPRRPVTPEEIATTRAVVAKYLPGAAGEVLLTATCVYTMTPDSHFIIDRHPTHPQVSYASACSGHGFKFSAVIGEIMADLALDGTTRHPIEFLSAARFDSAPV